MESVKDRLEMYLKYKRVNKSEFGRTIGVSSAYVSSIRKSIDNEKIKSIASNYPDLNVMWLLTGEGDMLGSSKNTQVIETNSGTAINGDGARVSTPAASTPGGAETSERRIDELLSQNSRMLDQTSQLLEQNGKLLDQTTQLLEIVKELQKSR